MALNWWNRLQIASGSITGPMCSDGTHIYFEIRTSALVHTLYKFSIASKTVVASVVMPGAYNWHGPIATNGTYVITGAETAAFSGGLRAFLCSDLSSVGVVSANSGIAMPNGEMGSEGCFDGTYFWVGGWSGAPNQLNRITPGTWTLAQFGNNANHTSSVNHILPIGSDLMLFGYGINGVKRVAKNGSVVWSNVTAGAVVTNAAYDPIRDEIWLNNANCEAAILRGSDGAWLDRLGNVVATFTLSKIVTGQDADSFFTNGAGVGIIGDSVVLAGGAANPGPASCRVTAPPRYSAGYWSSLGTYPGTPRAGAYFLAVGNTLYSSPSASGVTGWAGIAWLDHSDYLMPITPNLTAVAPGAGPRISLTFDNPVGITGPTLGPASSGLGVTGATQIDATHIDLATDYPPVHPLGEATEVAPPADNVRHW